MSEKVAVNYASAQLDLLVDIKAYLHTLLMVQIEILADAKGEPKADLLDRFHKLLEDSELDFHNRMIEMNQIDDGPSAKSHG